MRHRARSRTSPGQTADDAQFTGGTVRAAAPERPVRLGFQRIVARRARCRCLSTLASTRLWLEWSPGRELLSKASAHASRARPPESVVAYLVETPRQDMLQEATQELGSRERHRPPAVPLLAALLAPIAKGYTIGIDSEEAAVRDRHPVHVAGEVVEYRGTPLDRRFAVDHPGLSPHRRRHDDVGERRGESSKKACTEVH